MATIVDSLLEGVKLPKFVRIRQQFPTQHIAPEQIRDVVLQQLNRPQIAQTIQPGMSVCITSTSLGFSKIPMVMPSDRAAIQLCLRTCNRIDRENPRIIRIKNTLSLTEFEISEAMLPELKENMHELSAPYSLPFDGCGNLL